MLGPSLAGPAPQQSGGGGAAARQEGISDAPFGSHPVPPPGPDPSAQSASAPSGPPDRCAHRSRRGL